MKGSSQPLKPFILPVLVSAVTPQPQQCSWGAGRAGGRGTSHLCCRFLHWINGNQIVQPGESLEAKSCCWSPSCSVELLAWVCLGGNWDVGWDLGSLRLGDCHGGVPADVPGELFLTPPHGAVWRGRALGRARWRYVAWHARIPRECLAVEAVTSLSQIPWGAPRSSLWAGKCVSRVLQHTVGCGTGQIQPHPGEEHGTGTKPAFPFTGTHRQPGPHSLHPSSGAARLSHTPSRLHSSTWWHRGEILPQTIFSRVPAGN